MARPVDACEMRLEIRDPHEGPLLPALEVHHSERPRRPAVDGYLGDCLELKVIACSWLGGAGSGGGAGGDAKDFTALGGKVGSAGPGVEAEEGEAVDIGDEGVKLLTLGSGETDKDAVLQPVKAQIDRLKAASQKIVLEIPDIVGSLGDGLVEAARLCLVKEVIDKLDKLAGGLGDFGNHVRKVEV
jgi:hypothetical protein